MVEEGNRNIINEAFRVLRSNVDFMKNKNTDQKVFVITSFNPGSGKSFFSVNIATSFAIKGKKSIGDRWRFATWIHFCLCGVA